MEITFNPSASINARMNYPGATPIQIIVILYRNALIRHKQNIGSRDFAVQLNKITAKFNLSISHTSIHNWENGVTRPNLPFLKALRANAPKSSWQAQFASDLLAAMFPGQYRPSGLIGRTLLQGRRARRVP